MKETKGQKIFKVFNYTILCLLGLATFYPFWYVLVASFNTGRDFLKGGVWLYPRQFTLENYIMAFKDERIYQSLSISVSATLLSVVVVIAATLLAQHTAGAGRSGVCFAFAVLLDLSLLGALIVRIRQLESAA